MRSSDEKNHASSNNDPKSDKSYKSTQKQTQQAQGPQGDQNKEQVKLQSPGMPEIKMPDAPGIELPKGGGAIKGIGEKFTANPATGSASFTVPIAMSPGRSGFAPQLALSYDSGSGNSAFGLGWNVGVASISRKTQKELPQYRDAEESDTFILSGAEDLVPALLESEGDYSVDRYTSGEYLITRYRPRTEGLWAQIERFFNTTTGISHWKTISKDNLTSIYGESASCRIAHPSDDRKVFSWLLEKSYNEKGHVLVYEYKRENSDGLDNTAIHDAQRLKNSLAYTQLYIKKVYYGNTLMYDDPDFATENDWLFQLVFDYGEHTSDAPTEVADWNVRNDAFSTYRAGFEIRTWRLCERILMFHNFSELDTDPVLVKETALNYNSLAQGNQVSDVQHIAHQQGEDPAMMPALSFQYTSATRDETLRSFDLDDLENLPGGIDGQTYTWNDLYGEGINGILVEQARGWYYKRNYGDDSYFADFPVNDPPEPKIRLGALESVASRPNMGSTQQLGDLNGDGNQELLIQDISYTGYYEMEENGEWKRFKTIDGYPNGLANNPNVKRIDLNGDGVADIFISEDRCFKYYPSQEDLSFGEYQEIVRPFDENQGPAIVFADGEQSIYTADMSGDGLTDIVRIRNGEVCYWPNLGHGRFGFKVTMNGSPHFDFPDHFEQGRIKLADVDGSGTTDIIYLGREKVHYWQNKSGNGFALEDEIRSFPRTDRMSSVSVIDLFGKGTACLVWSSPLPGDEGFRVRYLDLMGQKPYLLNEIDNHMGMLQRMHYVPSTQFYQRDRFEGRPWITKLPFPVQVLDRSEIYDQISKARFVSRYAYHHGYFDRDEKEFRGFGMAEQWDSEQFDAFGSSGLFQVGSNLLDEPSHTPPVYTKTWFHTGYYEKNGPISLQYASEYYAGDTDAWNLNDSSLPSGLTATEMREALRTLRGQALRAEVYAEDGSSNSGKPYAVTATNYAVKQVQPKKGQKHGVFYSTPAETLSYHYERNEEDPRISHQMVLETDSFGLATKAAAIAYPRREQVGVTFETEQTKMWITYTEAEYIHETGDNGFIRIGVPYKSCGFEITGIAFEGDKLDPITLADAIAGADDLAYEESPTTGVEKRLIGEQRMYFYNAALDDALSLGTIAIHGLPHHALTLALTPGLVDLAYNNDSTTRVTETMLLTDGKYIKQDDLYWIPSPVMVFDDSAFYIPMETTDPFGNTTQFSYDSYSLAATSVEDAIGNTVSADIDYRVLAPWQMTDINGNRQQVGFDVRGMVVKMALMGKSSESLGDSLSDPTVKLTYDLFNWENNQQPNYSKTEARTTHGDPYTVWQTSYEYSGGLGQTLLVKVQAEPGDAFLHDEYGDLIVDGGGNPDPGHTDTRWLGNGRTIINNKGLAIKQYEPYFTDTSDFEDEDEVRLYGVTPIMHYDPMGRPIQTDMPDGSFTKVAFTPWESKHYDAVDTVMDSQWWVDRDSPDPGDSEPTDPDERAAWLATQHYNTPQVQVFDSIGRPFLTRDHYDFDSGDPVYFDVRVQMDIEGKRKTVTNPLSQNTVFIYSILPMDKEGNAQMLYTDSPDGGWRMALFNANNLNLMAWDERGFVFSMVYDALNRPTESYVDEGSGDVLVGYTLYGDNAGITSPEVDNLNGQAVNVYDQSGVVKTTAFNFKGNILSTERKFASNYVTTVDWTSLTGVSGQTAVETAASSLLETETFSSSVEYDALNRPTLLIRPDTSEITPSYNEAGMLETVDIKIRGAGSATSFITNIEYNEKAQRTKIVYANGSQTRYTYDPLTFRLTRLLTTRNSGADILQDLNYIFDPVGNIVEMTDDAQQTFYFANSVVTPNCKYQYDALYRLTKATGREHYGQGQIGNTDFPINTPVPQINNSTSVENYTEQYEYDDIGNILTLIHQAGSGNWSRGYDYGSTNNYLLKTSLPGDTVGTPATYTATYTHDVHGNMTSMPHLSSMEWDFMNQLKEVDLGGGGTAYYVYSGGQRVRKVIVNGTLTKDRFYLDGVNEFYRKYISSSLDYECETMHVMDERKRFAVVDTVTWDSGSVVSTPSPVIRYQLDNHLGSACLELDDSANIISYEEYHPFGTSAYRLGNTSAEVSLKRYRYVGKERDEESGLYYYGARYYVAWLCRFVSVDALKDDYPYYTPFQYAGNRPISFIDLDGLEPVDPNNYLSMLHSENQIDMSNAPKKYLTASGRWVYTKTNATGELRNHAWYWNEVRKIHPEFFDDANNSRIDNGRAPVVNSRWLEFHHSHSAWLNQILEHHHINHGNVAGALPAIAHRGAGNYKYWHLTKSGLGDLKKMSRNSPLAFIPLFDPTEWSGYFAKRPDSLFMTVESVFSPKVGVVYENTEDEWPGKYFIIREITEFKNEDGEVVSTMYVTDFYGELEDGYQELNEESFISQRVYYIDKEGNEVFYN